MFFYGNLFFQGDTATNGCDSLETRLCHAKQSICKLH
jgi:hypothetical protein